MFLNNNTNLIFITMTESKTVPKFSILVACLSQFLSFLKVLNPQKEYHFVSMSHVTRTTWPKLLIEIHTTLYRKLFCIVQIHYYMITYFKCRCFSFHKNVHNTIRIRYHMDSDYLRDLHLKEKFAQFQIHSYGNIIMIEGSCKIRIKLLKHHKM